MIRLRVMSILIVLFLSMSIFLPSSGVFRFASSKSNSSVSTFCPYIASGFYSEGMYPVSGGVLMELDVPSILMQLVFCSSTVQDSSVALPPADAPQANYSSMGGVQTSSFGTVLVLDNDVPPGFWFCEGATSSGCGIKSTYVTLPSSFCSSQPAGYCYPTGITLDNKMNVYFADPANAEVVKCTLPSGYQSCSVIETLSNSPYAIFRESNGTIWVTDSSCAGNVWKNGVLQYSFNDALGGVTISSANPSKTPHLYIAISARCGFYPFAFIYDVTDHTLLPTPFSGPNNIPTITTKLQFTSASGGAAYLEKDKT